MDQKEFRVLIKHCYLMKKNTAQTQRWLEECYGEAAPSKTTICRWFSEFKCGRTSTSDAARSGRPLEASTPENIKRIHRIILDDSKVKVREVADIIQISTERVKNILHEHLDMKKVYAKWVPRSLTIDQKQQRVNDAERGLKLYRLNENDFLNRFVAIGETWIHYHTNQNNRESTDEVESSKAKQPKRQQSTEKVLVNIFWNADGVIFIDYLERKKTIAKEYYPALLDRFNEKMKISNKRPQMADRAVLFHQDNSPPHISIKAMAKLNELKYDLLRQPPYSPDLDPSDYFLFPVLKRWLRGKRFTSLEDVECQTDAYFEAVDGFVKGIRMLEERWNKCIALEGNYIEE